jgi:hypothetical protein
MRDASKQSVFCHDRPHKCTIEHPCVVLLDGTR